MVIDTEEGLPSEWSPFNMRQYNLSILKPPLNKSTGSSSSIVSMSYTTPAKSLDLLRQNVQLNINSEIKTVISKFIDVYFKPGIENIRNNSGPDSVTDDHIHSMCRQILEDAKKMFPVQTSTPSPSPCNPASAIDPNESTDYQSSHQNPNQGNISDPVKLPIISPSFALKRESDTDSEASSLSNASKKIKKSNNKSAAANANASGVGNNTTGNNSNTNSTPSNKPKKPSGPSRKHVANWEVSRLTADTLFIMGAKANKALGFAQTRGRLYVKHPGLFKYASDVDDKEWLSKNKLMPATGGRAYIMLLDDIEKLARDNKLNVTINYEDIKGFQVPDFILDKMKSYITTWKKHYAEESQKLAAAATSRNRPPTSSLNSNHGSTIMSTATTTNSNNNSLPTLNPPPPPLPLQTTTQQMQQISNPHNNQQSLNSYHMSGNSPANIMYESTLMPLAATQQSHDMSDMREFIHIDKPPPMYPGHSGGQQSQLQQHAMPVLQNSVGGPYVHSTHNVDPIEQALSKGDWSGVSDRSLLLYALQSTRNLGSWDPQDSFDLIESVTNGSLSGGGSMDESSPLLQISPETGAHLTAPPIGPVSPNCELSAVLDQAFQYTDT